MQSDRLQPSVTIPTNVTPDHLSPLGFTYWQDGDFWLGYLDEFPDYVTQGESLVDLEDHLLSLYVDPANGNPDHLNVNRTTPIPSPPPMLTVEQAREYLLQRTRGIEENERIAVEDALGRIVAADVVAPIDVPGHANSAMDGYAVRAADIPVVGEATLRVTQRIAAGEIGSALAAGEAARIFTGAPVPEGADAIAIQEDCRGDGASVVVPGPLARGTFVRPRGNDIRSGAVVLAAGTRIRPQEMGVAASVGIDRIEVRRRPRVAIVSSGDELRLPGEPLGPGQIYNSNRFTLIGLLERLGCDVVDLGLVADTFEATRAALLQGADRADVLITTGGVSVGEEDHVRQALESIGELEMWKVRVKPGKPIVYGRIGTCDLLGLPGNPVSALVTFCLFVRPFILRRLGAARVFPVPVRVAARFEWPRPGGRREYARARLVVAEDGETGAEIHTRQGSDVLSATAWATGLVEIAEGTTIAPGNRVRYYSFGDLLD